MKKRLFGALSIAISVLLALSTFSAAFINLGVSLQPIIEPKGIDIDTKTAQLDSSEQVEPLGTTHHSYWEIGQTAIWTGYYSGVGVFLTYYTLSYVGTSVEIWVQNSIKFPSGDPRNGPGNNPGPTKPTYAMLEYLAGQYKNNILTEESEFFGAPVFHDGSYAQLQYLSGSIPDDPEYYYEPTGRAVILVCNIRDESYYDPNYPYYVIGVHIGSYESYYYDRNVVTLDAVSWYHSLGPADTNWGSHYYWPTDSFHDHPVTSPFAYDSTLAHEWQHLLHYELCPGDVTFMNEGCSMYAELLCGYGIDPDYLNSYFATPDNSLTEWGDQGDINILADYGAATLWCVYLADRFGASVLSQYFSQGGGGVEGIDYALYVNGYDETFPEVFHDWRLANLIRSDSPGGGFYNYKSLNLNTPEINPAFTHTISELPIPWMLGTDFGNTYTMLGYDTGISKLGSYGSDYIAMDKWNGRGIVDFDGDDFAIEGWRITSDGWWSGLGNMIDAQLIGNAYVDPANPVLTLVTKYSLETYWDFGFVQVSTDGGTTWTSLANAYTTSDHDPSANPYIVINLPGLTDYNPDWPDWTAMTFDLTAYSGMNVMIGFRYMTDWATNYEGWYVNSTSIGGTALTLAAVYPEAAFLVTAIHVEVEDDATSFAVFEMSLNDATEQGQVTDYAVEPDYTILVVSSTSRAPVDYAFHATKTVTSANVSIAIDPQTLNLKSNGNYITAYVEPPQGYDVQDIIATSILLNNTISKDPNAAVTVCDHDGDSVPDLTVKFSRETVIDYVLDHINLEELLKKRRVEITMTLTGTLIDGTTFEGRDTITAFLWLNRGMQES